MKRYIKNNIIKLYLVKISKWFMLYMPVIKLFYEENNFGNTEYLALFAIYSIVIALLEIPSGYLGDVWGRKKLLVLGTTFGFIGFGIYSFSTSFIGFLSAEISLGIGLSFISGSDSAILYDTLLEMKKEKEYVKYEGRVTAAGNFSEAIAGLIGPLLAISSARIPYFYQTGISFLGIIASISLIEPGNFKLQAIHKFSYILKIVKYTLYENKILQKFILFSSVIGFSSLIMARLTLIFFSEINLPRPLYGVLWPILNLIVGVGSLLSFKIHSILKDRFMIIWILFIMSLSYILLGTFITYYGLIVLFIFTFVRGTAHPILKNYINNHSSSNIRATVLSIRSLIIRLIAFIFAPFIGWISDKIDFKTALFASGIVIFISGAYFLFFILKSFEKAK